MIRYAVPCNLCGKPAAFTDGLHAVCPECLPMALALNEQALDQMETALIQATTEAFSLPRSQ